MNKQIIDLSEWQLPSKINYDLLAKQVSLAILRLQYGSDYQDRHAARHYAELQKRQVPLNVYAWVRGSSISDMGQEARDFKRLADQLNPYFPVYWLDVEEQSMADMRAGVTAFARELRRLGAKKVGVYVAHHLYSTFNLDLSQFDALWLPHYGTNSGFVTSQPDYPSDLHQYTSRGRLEGYQGDLDLNRLRGSKSLAYFTQGDAAKNSKNLIVGDRVTVKHTANYWRDGETIAPWVKGSQFIIQAIQEKQGDLGQRVYRIGPQKDGATTGYLLAEHLVENRDSITGKVHRVRAGESLWLIARQYGMTTQQLYAKNRHQINNPSLIFPGQELVIH